MTINILDVNDAPTGTDTTVTTNEDTAYVFQASDFAFSDSDGNTLQAVKIGSLPGGGNLTLDGAAVNAGDVLIVADINAGKLAFAPAADANGAGYASFTFQVQDDGGTDNGGVDLDQSPNTITVDVAPVNDAPVVTGQLSASVYEDGSAVTLDGLANASDVDGDPLTITNISTLPAGVTYATTHALALADISGISIPVDSSDAGDHPLNDGVWSVSAPPFPINDNIGIGYLVNPITPIDFVFTLHDHQYVQANVPDPTRAVITFQFASSTMVTDLDVIEHTNGITRVHAYAGYSLGSLTDVGDVFGSLGDLTGVGAMVEGEHNYFHLDDATFGTYFQVVIDKTSLSDGYAFYRMFLQGTTQGGFTLDPTNAAYQYLAAGEQTQVTVNYSISDGTTTTPSSAIFTVTGVNDAPAGSDQTVATNEDTSYTFTAANFGYSDPIDTLADAFAAVKITTLPGSGALKLDGVLLSVGQFVSVADINAGKLVFTPAADANGAACASFTFQVQDDGGTANGGVDLDQSPSTITINVTPVNDTPSITSDGGGDTATRQVAENGTAVTTVTASDPDTGQTLVYSIVGGADAALFAINQAGALSFLSARDFENPTDAGADNVYDVVVRASDGFVFDTQAISISVTNVAGVTINGNNSNNTVNATQTISLQPFPTNEEDIIYGFGGTDTLSSLGGNDTIDGGAQADRMTGGTGNDKYIVDVTGDTVVELANEGTDLVESLVTFTLAANVENLTLTGSANINGTGNGLANILIGNGGNNILDGGLGADTMSGLGGNDIYVVDNAGDVIDELISGSSGIDEIRSGINFFSLADLVHVKGDVENLTLIGSADINGTGNALDNAITGNSGKNALVGGGGIDNIQGQGGDDRISGGLGNDILSGGNNKDVFVFDTAPSSTLNIDAITDFANQDKIELNHTIFASLAVGALSAASFRLGTSAADSNDFIIYNKPTGALSYDADGSGSTATAIQFATLTNTPNLSAGDFIVV